MEMTRGTLRKFWGQEVEQFLSDGRIIWTTTIRNPFSDGERLRVSLNECLLLTAAKEKVSKIIVNIPLAGKEPITRMINPPTLKGLKLKEKRGEYTEQVFKIPDQPMKLYQFDL